MDLKQSSSKAREEIVRYLEAALATGDEREARRWASRLKKIDELIAGYGVEAKARRPA